MEKLDYYKIKDMKGVEFEVEQNSRKSRWFMKIRMIELANISSFNGEFLSSHICINLIVRQQLVCITFASKSKEILESWRLSRQTADF